MSDFITFNVNALSYFAYLLITNIWYLFLVIGTIGTILLNLKEEIDISVREEQNII